MVLVTCPTGSKPPLYTRVARITFSHPGVNATAEDPAEIYCLASSIRLQGMNGAGMTHGCAEGFLRRDPHHHGVYLRSRNSRYFAPANGTRTYGIHRSTMLRTSTFDLHAWDRAFQHIIRDLITAQRLARCLCP
jgi:hypothetical protein